MRERERERLMKKKYIKIRTIWPSWFWWHRPLLCAPFNTMYLFTFKSWWEEKTIRAESPHRRKGLNNKWTIWLEWKDSFFSFISFQNFTLKKEDMSHSAKWSEIEFQRHKEDTKRNNKRANWVIISTFIADCLLLKVSSLSILKVISGIKCHHSQWETFSC